jgi:hypothetical protein
VIALWTQAHIDRLRSVFPDRCPDPGTDHRVVDRLTGNIEVVRWIESEFRQQQEITHDMTGGIR